MLNKSMLSLNTDRLSLATLNESRTGMSVVENVIRASATLLFFLTICLAFTGCGSGGYAGGGVVSLSSSAVTLDAGQSFAVSSKLSGTPVVSWVLSSAACGSSSCGALSNSVGASTTYTAPSNITSQLKLTLTAGVTGTKNSSTVSITVNPDPTISGAPPVGTVGSAYTATLIAAGGTAPLKWSVAGGSLPAGLSFNAATGVISGTPTVAGTSSFSVQIIDSSDIPFSVTAQETVVISTGQGTSQSGPLTVLRGNPPAGTVGTAYSTTLTASGGATPYSWSIISGALPAGLGLSSSTGLISGTPTAQGVSSFTAQVQDASGTQASAPFSITINPAQSAATLTLTNLPGATVGVPYTGTIGATGGTSPYSCVITAGMLPAGLTQTGCIVSGTPTAPGSSTVTVKVTDSGNPVATATGPVTLTVSPAGLSLTLSSLPNATVGVPYTATIGVAGGTSPYSCAITAGILPAGLSVSGCVVSGTPTFAGTANLMVKATDSSSPVETTTGPESLTVLPAGLSLTLSSLPNATVGVPYTATIGVAGGTSPYSCAITAGILPAGLSVSGCVVSGTPTVAGTANLTVKATDSSSPVETTTGPESLTVLPAGLSLTLSSLPNATVGVPYTATIGVAGGTSPYSCAITAGILPAGLSVTGCVVSGTPTVAGTANLTVKATDSSPTVETTTGPESLTVLPATITLTLTSPPNATVGTPYIGTIGVNGGTSPYSCTITSGTLPAGLSISNCAVSGTPTVAGTANLTVKAVDTSNPVATTTGPVTLVVSPATATLTLTSPPNATVGTVYSGTIGVSGGTAPYSCTIMSGTLPAGLTAAGCVINGTPTTAGTANLVVKATDSATPTATTTGPVTLTVLPIPTLSLTGSLPNAILGQPYMQTLLATGGIQPYKYQVTAGNLPAGLSLSTSGVISGTPTTPGASSFTVTVTDTETTPQTASLPLVLLVVYPTTPNDVELTGPYAFLFQGYDDVLAGVLAYQTATVGSFTADGTGVVSNGELDANHQSSAPTGTTVSSNDFLGTYTIGTDSRGSLTITTLNQDGTTAGTSTYAIALKAPVSPATISTRGDLIEFDNNSLQGTRGSGTLLAQQTAAFAAGLNGSYAFGLSGDTPCLPACTLGIVAGPAASVGQFTASGSGLISSGSSDANIATTNYASETLSGSYGSADANGRVQLAMSTTGTPAAIYPTDYAVYLVSANEAFVLSTDKHSSYVLLAGSAQLQTQATFTNASMSGPFVGYENAQSNPGLLGSTLQNVLNLSTSTIFRGTASGGSCNITNVDVAGTTALVNQITGLGGLLPTSVVQDLLGTYQSTGTAGCPVANSDGRGVLNYPVPTGLIATLLGLLGLDNPPAPRVFYLISPDNAYFLETGYAGLGNFEPQTGAPFSNATLDGTFVYGTTPASSLAGVNGSGTITANGAGSATSTLDLNVGVGTINVLQLGVTSTMNYNLTDATAGRYTYGTSVLYAISPSRFVLLDTSILSTSPSVALLY
ncbi:putative Ig domain-containing protein [Tunturibacter empetritectus]|uniref:Ig domain-containing protein n=1 Tax=Tunturiibacter empetritectus TaxID=3069691 RepID=A0AAU7ZDV0_9BACT